MNDLIIIGAGIAGVTCGIYANNKGLKVVLIDEGMIGGTLNYIDKITNYPGIKEISGPDLASSLSEQVKANNITYYNEKIKSVTNESNVITVTTTNNTYQAKNLVIATGRSQKKLNLPNEQKLWGHGISSCAMCDGNFYRDKAVAVVGGGNKALHDVNYLKNICKKVYLINNDNDLEADVISIDELSNISNVQVIYNEVITSINGSDKLESIDTTKNHYEIDALFLAIGSIPNLKLFENLNLDITGNYLLVDQKCHTNIKNIYAIGDCIKKDIYQLVTAANDGIIAASNINK